MTHPRTRLMYPTWVTTNTGNLPQKLTSTKLTFNPSTGILSATSFTGAGTGIDGHSLFVSLSIGGNAATVTNGIYSTDTGTVTNTMLAGSIANAKLANSSLTVAGHSISFRQYARLSPVRTSPTARPAAPAAAGTSGATTPLNNGNNTISGANSITGVMTFTNSDWRMLGSSTGYTALTSDNAGASEFLPPCTCLTAAANDTLADLAGTQTCSPARPTTPPVAEMSSKSMALALRRSAVTRQP